MFFKARPEAIKETTHRLDFLEMIQEDVALTTNPVELAESAKRGITLRCSRVPWVVSYNTSVRCPWYAMPERQRDVAPLQTTP
jgi:hypothetical protein